MAAANTVTVACKLPHGLILRLQKTQDVHFNMGGAPQKSTIQVPDPASPSYIVAGFARASGMVPDAKIIGAVTKASDNGPRGGFALTPGIPKDFWDRWLEQNKDADYVKNGFILANAAADHLEGHARDRKAELSGFEPMDPANPPAEFRRKTLGIEAA